MAVTLSKKWQLKVGSQTMVVPDACIRKCEGTGFLKLSPINYGIVKLLTGGKVAKNSSISGSPGLQAIQKARNIACNLMPPDEPATANAMQVGKGATRPTKRAKKTGPADTGPLVTFEVPGAEFCGKVTVRKCVRHNADIQVPMVEAEIQKVLEVIEQIGVEVVVVTRAYTRSGKYRKKDEKSDEDSDSDEDGDSEDEKDKDEKDKDEKDEDEKGEDEMDKDEKNNDDKDKPSRSVASSSAN